MRALVFILVVCAMMATVFAAKDEVAFHGSRQFSNGDLLAYWGAVNLSDSAEFPPRCQALEDSLIAQDYVFAHVDSCRLQTTAKGKRVLHVFLQDGSPARITSVRWLGDSARVSAAVSAHMECRVGALFHWSSIAQDAENLLTFFENVGYPFAKVEVRRVDADSAAGTVDVYLLLSSGPFTNLQFLSFPGARQTKEDFLRRESRLRIGDVYAQKRLEVAHRRLARLDFIRQVGQPEIAINETGQTGVHLPLEEAHATRLDLAAGYLPQSANQKALFTGLVNLEFLNLFGSGRRARIHWERPDRRVQAVELAYREPWVLNQPLALQFSFAQRIEDTLYVTRHFTARADVDVSAGVRIWGAVQQEAVLTDSAAAAALGVPESQTVYVETGIALDTRDHPTNPRGGAFFSTYAGTAWRHRDWAGTSVPSGSFRQQRGGIDSEVAHEIVRDWIADLALHARFLETDEPQVLLPDLYRVGGARTLRGYREEQFLGSRAGWASAELRYWLGPASRVFVFSDAGGIYRAQLVSGVEQSNTLFRASVGVGLRLETGLGIWGVDYAVGQEDRPLNGKIHISLLSMF
jgi:outer membrane protein assembly factor BamA